MLIPIHPENPTERGIIQVLECLNKGGIIIYPTDTVYAFGCLLNNKKGIERIAKLRSIKPEKAEFSLVCSDLSTLSDYTTPISNSVFRLMKRALPGPFTFILNANNNVPKLFRKNKKTIGIRVPENKIVQSMTSRLDLPLLSSSLHDVDDILEYMTDPELIHERYMGQVDIVIDGGYGGVEASTIVDCTGDSPEIVRQGLGILEE